MQRAQESGAEHVQDMRRANYVNLRGQLKESHEPTKQTSVVKFSGAQRMVDYREYSRLKPKST